MISKINTWSLTLRSHLLCTNLYISYSKRKCKRHGNRDSSVKQIFVEHYHIPSPVSGAGDKTVKKTDKNLHLMPYVECTFGGEGYIDRKTDRKIGGRKEGRDRVRVRAS